MKTQAKLINKYWTDIYFHTHYPHKEKISHQVVRILQVVEKQDSVGINEIASYLKVSHNTASEHIKRIIEKGYLIKNKHPQDERKVTLCLTEFGREVLHHNTSLDEEKLGTILNGLSDQEQRLIEEALKLLSESAKKCT
ncbi:MULTISPECIES: MarR family winged helix-turn-helix transcriptional regulator [unclassified Bacillus (in: firmicutes)]|uniref:MarR family winged helix-turn-helix transcriptional regulator n=1 Tax=unclassified Bacillus (in: firmicutes) TaxID=185979 RepID=UPI0008E85E96|nr:MULTISPECIES: MarR family winged helix-turn-helix transcriptional regulator [unclassified Bacillus (in: firmicutes)]SFA69781.1 DNA-binding transcriptional regulator, MarR family [Bacillus sp. UNCCL13]SFQ59148.1 DNA-binding transcriptional regulator, MarR family [Bacillus sp. cl95]